MAESHLTVPGRYDRLEQITEFVAQAARRAGLGDRAVFHCQVAVDEACTNIILHAYGGEGRGDIELTCQADPGELTIILEDRGETFDPESIQAPDLSVPMEDLSEGGLGVHLMRQLMDQVDFQASRNRNRLIMVKRDSANANHHIRGGRE